VGALVANGIKVSVFSMRQTDRYSVALYASHFADCQFIDRADGMP
jgi:hypothetical protein